MTASFALMMLAGRRLLEEALGDIDLDIEGMQRERAKVVAAIEALGSIVPEPTPIVPSTGDPNPRKLPKPKVVQPLKKAAQAKPGESKYDYAEIARIAIEANAAAKPMSTAVCDALGVSKAMGGFLIGEARRRGFAVPLKPQGRKPNPPAPKVVPLSSAASIPEPPADLSIDDDRPDPEHPESYQAVADAYIEAEQFNRRPIAHIADLFGVRKSTVQRWVEECRRLNLLRPRDEPQIDRVAPNPPVKVSSF